MALAPFRVGLKVSGLGSPAGGILSTKAKLIEVRAAAFISSKAMRTDAPPKPAPWPYKEKGYTNFHAMYDSTRKRLDENSKVIIVEGPPCIGKTELAKNVAADLDMQHIPMFTMDDYFINPYGFDKRNLDPELPPRIRSFDIDKFIKNPNDDRAVLLQHQLYIGKYFRYISGLSHLLNTGQGVVIERSVYSDSAFVDAMLACGYMNKKERDLYYKWRQNNLSDLLKPHLVIYLDVPAATVEQNLKKRGKGEEKACNKTFLEALEESNKYGFLKSITEHAELLVYDWSTPGDPEAVVEDIERIDFDRFWKHDPKMNDWRIKEEWDWCERRWEYTNEKNLYRQEQKLCNFDFEENMKLYLTGEEVAHVEIVEERTPSEKYAYGFNPAMGDNVLFKGDRVRPREPVVDSK